MKKGIIEKILRDSSSQSVNGVCAQVLSSKRDNLEKDVTKSFSESFITCQVEKEGDLNVKMRK